MEKVDRAIRQNSENKLPSLIDLWARGILSTIKELPQQISAMVALINAPSATPALQCALIGTLSYVAQPRDLVPDDAPGGYGFIDDKILLMATTLQTLEPTPANAEVIEQTQKQLAYLTSLLPSGISPALDQAMQGLVLLYQTLCAMPAQVAYITMQGLLDNPLNATPPAAPAGWRMPDFASAQKERWSGGVYYEGDNIVIPGGPSLINGQLYIPR